MSELAPPVTHITEVYDAFQLWTHFLNPKGMQNHHIGDIGQPLAYQEPESNNDEVAWTHIEHHTQIQISIDGRPETATSMRHQYGDLQLVTKRDELGRYIFTPLSELVEAETLPIYTASWLARYTKTWNRNRLTGIPTYPTEFTPLRDKAPFSTILQPDEVKSVFPKENDKRSVNELRSIAIDERAARLASETLKLYPYLEIWYKEREIPIQDEQTSEQVLAAIANR